MRSTICREQLSILYFVPNQSLKQQGSSLGLETELVALTNGNPIVNLLIIKYLIPFRLTPWYQYSHLPLKNARYTIGVNAFANFNMNALKISLSSKLLSVFGTSDKLKTTARSVNMFCNKADKLNVLNQ